MAAPFRAFGDDAERDQSHTDQRTFDPPGLKTVDGGDGILTHSASVS